MLTLITLQKSSLLSKPGFHMLSSPISSPSPRVKLEAEKKQREVEERERRKIYAEMEEEEGTNSKEEVTRDGEGKTESEDNEDDVEKDQDEKESVLARDPTENLEIQALDKGGYTYTRLVYSCSDTHKYKPCIQRFYKARTLMSRYTQIQASYSEVYEARKTMSGILQIRASYTKAISYTSRIRGSYGV